MSITSFSHAQFSPGSAPRTHLIMRHALAPGTGDPTNFTLGDCSTQRNLNAHGRTQAQKTGKLLRSAGIKIDLVWSGRWCRNLETANLLGLGSVLPEPNLDSIYRYPKRRQLQTKFIKRKLLALKPDVTVFLVTHQFNIIALLGESNVSSGEVIVFQISSDGELQIVDRMLIKP